MTTQRIAYSYRRFSSSEQRHGDSIRRQADNAKAICQEFGWHLKQIFEDKDRSAYRSSHSKKGNLGLFLKLVEDGEIEDGAVLIVEDLDRLSRDKISVAESQFKDILGKGVDIFTVMNRKLYTRESLDEPMAIMEVIWRIYLSHEESNKKSYRSTANWKEKHRKAKEGTSLMTKKEGLAKNVPAWLEIKNGKFRPVPERVKTIKVIFQLCIDGMGIHATVKELARHHAPFYGAWAEKSVWQILTDGRVLGKLQTKKYGKDVTDGEVLDYYPRVIDDDTFLAAQNAISSRRGKKGKRGKVVNLFQGILYHVADKCNMVFIDKSQTKRRKERWTTYVYQYLISNNAQKGIGKYEVFSYQHIEAGILSVLTELDLAEILSNKQTKIEAQALQGRLGQIREKVAEIGEEIKAGASAKLFTKLVTELEAEEESLTAKLKEVQAAQHKPQLENLHELIAEINTKLPQEQIETRTKLRQAIRLLVERIEFYSEEGRYTMKLYLFNGCERTISLDKQTGAIVGSGGTWLNTKNTYADD